MLTGDLIRSLSPYDLICLLGSLNFVSIIDLKDDLGTL